MDTSDRLEEEEMYTVKVYQVLLTMPGVIGHCVFKQSLLNKRPRVLTNLSSEF